MEVSALAGNGMERAVETDAAVAAGLRRDVSGAVVTQKRKKAGAEMEVSALAGNGMERAVSDVITENDKNIYNFA